MTIALQTITSIFKSKTVYCNQNMIKNSSFIIGITTLIFAGIIGTTFGKEIGNEISGKLFQNTGTKPEIVSTTGLTQAHKDGHIQSCVQSGGNQKYCECTFEYIKDKITPEELKEYAKEYQVNPVLPDIFKDALAECISKAEQSSTSTSIQNQPADTALKIEKCKVTAKNVDIWDENIKIAEQWNQINAGLKAQGIIPTQEDALKFYNENIEKYRNKLYEDCLNKI